MLMEHPTAVPRPSPQVTGLGRVLEPDMGIQAIAIRYGMRLAPA